MEKRDYSVLFDDYYNDKLYNTGGGSSTRHFSISGVINEYNPTNEVVDRMTSLVFGKEIEYIGDTGEYAKETMNKIDFNGIKRDLMFDLFKYKKLLVEVIDVKGELSVQYYNDYKIHKNRNKIIYAKINAETSYVDANNDLQTENIERIYNLSENKLITRGVKENSIFNEVSPIPKGIVPIFEISCNYDLFSLFTKIDTYNEMARTMNVVCLNHSDPQYVIELKEQVSKQSNNGFDPDNQEVDDEDEIAINQHVTANGRKVTEVTNGSLKLLEYQAAALSPQITRQQNLIKLIETEYPELNISQSVEGGQVSTETMRLKLQAVLSKVNSIRETGLTRFIKNIVIIAGKFDSENIEFDINYKDLLDETDTERIDNLKTLSEIGFNAKDLIKLLPKHYMVDISEEVKIKE